MSISPPRSGGGLDLTVLPAPLSVCRQPPEASWPEAGGGFFAAVRTAAELSVVCEVGQEPPGARCEGPWRALEVAGPLDFALTGVLAALAAPLAAAEIPIFALSTFDTDYLLVAAPRLPAAVEVLRRAGFRVRSPELRRHPARGAETDMPAGETDTSGDTR
ncbi:MAG: ACT domain-containing protein [Acidobacteriota bacterium]|nr:ACT domain-containing protein [Acidobacteriota bacterium]